MSGKRRAEGPAVKKPARPPLTRKQKLKRAGKWALLAGLAGTLLGLLAFVALYMVIDIPDPNEDFQTETSFVYYADGKTELGKYVEQQRTSIDIAKMPDHLQDAVVAAENQSFWTDKGIDPKGILRAAFSNASGGTTQGASTITQQYVKVLYLSQEQSYKRKIKEAILSLKIQREESKEDILEGYLNTIYFGRGAYGVEAAARAYFDKPASRLNLRESAALARILNNPLAYDPANGPEARERLKAGYDFVLNAMVDTEAITAEQAEQAKKRLPKFPKMEQESTNGGQRGHVLTLVKKELMRLGFDEEEIDGQGLKVTTTLTEKAMEAAKAGVLEVRPSGFPGAKQLHAAVASVEPGTGALRGFYGGQDYLESQINWAVAGGQGGSTMKAFALAAAIKDGFSLNDTFEGNSPIIVGGEDYENQGDRDYGSAVSMVTAAENSINTAFIDMTDSMENGPQKIVKMANAMGIPPAKAPSRRAPGMPSSSPGLNAEMQVALGSATVSPINMATGYATIANEGVYAEPYLIEKVVDRGGEVVYDHSVQTKRVLDEGIAHDVSYALQRVVEAGSGTQAQDLGRPAAGKTGTATRGDGAVSSAWFAGFTPQLATAVMYVRGPGNGPLDGWLPSYEGLEGYFGGNYPARTWTAVMDRALEGEPVEDLPDPEFVDGDAPDDGHAPIPSEAPETDGQSSGPRPSQSSSAEQPTQEPTTQAPTTAPPSSTAPPPPPPSETDCTILGGCETEEPTGQPTSSPTASPSGAASRSPAPSRGRAVAAGRGW